MKKPLDGFPGTPQHKALLQAVVSHYEHDRRVQAVILFGSLVRGDWDAWSDLDLDVILTDDSLADFHVEMNALRQPLAEIGERILLIISDDPQEGDIVLESLMRLSIRYHILDQTSPNILDSVLLLAGSLDAPTIAAAGMANRRPVEANYSAMIDRFLYYGVIASVCLRRGQVWTTVEILHRMRNLLMELYACTHDAPRAYKYFDAKAGSILQSRFGETLPGAAPLLLNKALFSLLEIVGNSLDDLGNGRVKVTPEQTAILKAISKAG